MVAGIKSTYNENLVINFPDDETYTWTIGGAPVENNVFEVAQTDSVQNRELTIAVTFGGATVEATVNVTINAIPAPAPEGQKTVTLIATELGLENSEAWPETTLDEITISAASNGGTAPAYYNTGNALRLYGGNVLTITADEGYKISSVKITTVTTNSNKLNNETPSAGVKTVNDSGTETTFSNIDANTWTLTNGNSSGHYRITEITVVYVPVTAA